MPSLPSRGPSCALGCQLTIRRSGDALVAVRGDDRWRIAVYQNTPAAFRGRPDLSQALTEELRRLL
jgi:hypothetical protein